MKISLIITTYNWSDALKLVLESIKRQVILPNEVIIADDGSNNETKELIKNYKKNFPINIIHCWQEDKGFRAARIRNMAIATSSYEYIIGIDGDIILDKYFVKDHIKHAKKGRYIQGSRVLTTKQTTNQLLKEYKELSFFSKGLKNRKNSIRSNILSKIFSKETLSLRGVKTCNFSIYKSDIEKINGFDNNFIGWGREDSDFVARFLNSGGKRFNLKFNAIAYHLYHNENSRKALEENDIRLKNSIENRVTICNNGLKELDSVTII
jgi:GT2 family glycosyltransferase